MGTSMSSIACPKTEVSSNNQIPQSSGGQLANTANYVPPGSVHEAYILQKQKTLANQQQQQAKLSNDQPGNRPGVSFSPIPTNLRALPRQESYAGQNALPPDSAGLPVSPLPPQGSDFFETQRRASVMAIPEEDGDDNEVYDEKEIESQYEDENSAAMRRLRQEFDKYDLDHNGYIDFKELDGVLRGIYEPNEDDIHEFLSKFDLNNDGSISFEEFKSAMKQLHRFNKPKSDKLLQRIFEQYDTNGDGTINGDELRSLAKEALHIDPSLKRRAMELFDTDRDKVISFSEFAANIGRLHLTSLKRTKSKRVTTIQTRD